MHKIIPINYTDQGERVTFWMRRPFVVGQALWPVRFIWGLWQWSDRRST